MTDLASLNDMNAEALRDAFSGPPAEVARLLRVAAEGGAVEAQLRLGQMALDGHGVPPSPVDALRWFGMAAKAGHPMGMNMVGRCLEHGWGTAIDTARAADWYRAAADHGLDWGFYNLATLLSLGDGVEKDPARALGLFAKAAALGHAKSINMVGSFYEDGWAVTQDRAAAAVHYRRAAEGGDFRGRFNHARLLIEGGEVDDALGWLRRVPESATPRFMAQMCAWLARQSDPRLCALANELGLDL
ncbi:tetratricopeptide repeat protein [Sphingomonas abietis]|uniref:Tetratricopeptide repeat protein n=1 Tax=Sphingomonas abietis TaxID=3012344 RepID=A0ABY7NSU7_9SPHN|nr:tetratricopeptide repeat protein [Sphingomonas abietis]WBO22551.1 tetratricopeptide repeat protein [Sphingomonas abietis]